MDVQANFSLFATNLTFLLLQVPFDKEDDKFPRFFSLSEIVSKLWIIANICRALFVEPTGHK